MDGMDKGTPEPRPAQLRQHSRHGIIRVAQLERLGIASYTAYRRCGPDGPWQWVLPGIVSIDRAPLTHRQLLEAALLHGGEDALVTGAAACRLYGLREAPTGDQVHLLLPAARQVRSAGHALIERTRRYPTAHMWEGLPIAPLDRAVLDCVRRIRVLNPVRALLIEAVQHGGCRPNALRAELDSGSQRGTAVPRRALGEIDLGICSVAEAHTERLWRAAGLPAPMRNVDVYDNAGEFIAVPDLWWDDVALAWEIDSFAFHFKARDYARTVRRNTRYARAGVAVVQTLPTQLHDHPDAVVRDLSAAFLAAAARPRPNVTCRQRAA